MQSCGLTALDNADACKMQTKIFLPLLVLAVFLPLVAPLALLVAFLVSLGFSLVVPSVAGFRLAFSVALRSTVLSVG